MRNINFGLNFPGEPIVFKLLEILLLSTELSTDHRLVKKIESRGTI